MNFNIIQDTREQFPWDFSFYENMNTTVKKLDTGDYTLEGYEDKLFIDRKASSSEIATNLGKQKKRFDAEMIRASTFKYKFIICEFSVVNLMEFPKNSGIPKSQLSKVRTNPSYMLKCLNEYTDKYGIEVIFAGSRESAIEVAIDIFKGVIEDEVF